MNPMAGLLGMMYPRQQGGLLGGGMIPVSGGQSPMADLKFTMTPQMYNPNAQAEQQAMADRMYHNDQPVNRQNRLDNPMLAPNIGERGTDPWGSANVEWNNRMLQRPDNSYHQQMLDLLAGAGRGI